MARWFQKKDPSVADNAMFVLLVQVAREEPEIGTQLRRILSLEPFHRKSALNTFIDQMRLKDAPETFVSAVAALLDDSVAEKVLELLS